MRHTVSFVFLRPSSSVLCFNYFLFFIVWAGLYSTFTLCFFSLYFFASASIRVHFQIFLCRNRSTR